MESERALFLNAVKGMVISLCFACAVIFLATRNWIVTLYAVHAVAFICASEIALQRLRGYEMGVAESIGSICIIGYSVDYVVHLAAHYVHSAALTRHARTTESIGEMGVSILGGALTTCGSASFLFLCHLEFFRKFAFMITTTAALALLFSVVYFVALSHSFGPEGNSGNMNKTTRQCLKSLKDAKGDGEKKSSSSSGKRRKRIRSEKSSDKQKVKKPKVMKTVELVSIHDSDSVELA